MGLELDEYIYGKLVKFLKKKKQTDKVLLSRIVYLEEIKQQLTIIARAVTGKAIEIYPAEREGGYKDNSFFLPTCFAELASKEQNKAFYYYRVLYLSIQQKLKFNWIDSKEYTLEQSQKNAYQTSQIVLRNLFYEFSGVQEIYYLAQKYFSNKNKEKNTDYSWLYGKWMNNEIEKEEDKKLKNTTEKVKTSNQQQANTILKAHAVEEIKTLQIDKKQQEDYVMLHNFEKVETVEEFSGSWRDFDGEDELEEHKEALEELSMKYTVRVDDTAHSVYQADFVENTTVAESSEVDEKGIYLKYDEWDFSKAIYKNNFCKLYPKTQIKTDLNYYKKTINKNTTVLTGLRKLLTNVNNRQQQQKKQLQGNEFDVDAITDLYIDIQSKKTPSENVYIANRKKEKDISILLLLDISLSSDGYVANNRVIDVEKEVSILFGEILNEFKIDFSIDSFYSKTRNYANYLTIKEFDEKWDTAKYKVGAVEPQGYTRIGTALRHAGARLEKRDTKNKWIILLSDGKPNDYDKYEGKYGINDVKQALRELNQKHINSYALAIEAQAKYYLPQMFGHNNYQILTTPIELLQSLVFLFEKINK